MTTTSTQTPSENTSHPEQIWDLQDLYASLNDQAIARDRESLKQDIQDFVTQYGAHTHWQESPEALALALKDYTRLIEKMHNLGVYVNLEWNTATQDPECNALRDQIQRELAEAGAEVEFFRQGLSAFSPEQLTALMAHESLKPYGNFLKKTAAFQPFLLSTAEERMLQLTQPYSRQRWLDFYTQTSSTWTFEVGEDKDLTEDQVVDYMRQKDPQNRLLAYDSLYGTYGKNDSFISYIYSTLLQEYAQEARLRQFDNTLTQQAFDQELTANQVKRLLSEVNQRLGLYQRYYQALAHGLGVEKLRSCDLSAPLRDSDWEVDWDSGKATLMEALTPLGQDLNDKTEAFFKHRWIHAEPAKGKASGAFCAPTAHTHPYILMNWNDSLNALNTLAHELGHGIHFYSTAESENILHMMPPLFLAETASTLNEYLLAMHLLDTHTDAESQRYLLSDLLQRFMNGTYRQSQITEFEVFAHETGASRALTAEELNGKWLELAQQRAGDAFEVLPQEASGWSRIPHLFMYPFYCYNYTLSGLIVLALVHQYEHQREAFLQRYQRFLSAGGSKSATELLQLLELDLDDPAFYEAAFQVLENWIERLETLNTKNNTNNEERG